MKGRLVLDRAAGEPQRPRQSVLVHAEFDNMVEAAAIPETFFTVWTNVFERGRLRSGRWCWCSR